MNALIIVDPQNDFITGSLPVPGAQEAMRALAGTLGAIPADEVFVTADCHPFGHTSFKEEGGIWPVHCVKYSEGAAIEPVLLEALRTAKDKATRFLEKATAVDKDEYSAFETGYPKSLDEAETIFVAGLAGDVCVQTSIRDLAKHGLKDKITVITDAAPSLDGGARLGETIRELGLKKTTLKSLNQNNTGD